MSDSLWPHELHHARLPCPSPTPGACSNSCPPVGDAIQPCHPLSSPSSLAFNPSQHRGLFQWVSSSHRYRSLHGIEYSSLCHKDPFLKNCSNVSLLPGRYPVRVQRTLVVATIQWPFYLYQLTSQSSDEWELNCILRILNQQLSDWEVKRSSTLPCCDSIQGHSVLPTQGRVLLLFLHEGAKHNRTSKTKGLAEFTHVCHRCRDFRHRSDMR